MQRQPLVARQRDRIAAGLPFVESLARRVASSMPHSIELGDLVQDGMLGLIDAACRFDEARGIKFETFAERRVRGAMIDALRRDAWPRGVRRQRRELEAAREELRRELGAEPSLADLAARDRLRRSAPRPHHRPHQHDRIDVAALGGRERRRHRRCRPRSCRPSRRRPIEAYEEREVRDRVRAAIASLPPRERKVIGALLLRRSDDEADWRGDWRQRIARLAAARARGAAAARRRSAPTARRTIRPPALRPAILVVPADDEAAADGEVALPTDRRGPKRRRWCCPTRRRREAGGVASRCQSRRSGERGSPPRR